jgi:pimeloyl-ACP methyl ester carboxylesterase
MANPGKPTGDPRGEVRTARSFDGTPIAYEVVGDGAPLVLLHGFLSGRRTFSRQRAEFARRFRLILVSSRGHDGTDAQRPVNYGAGSSDVDDLRMVLHAEGIACASLLGHSSGGATAFSFACRYPDRVSRLILVEPTLLGLLHPADRARFSGDFERVIAAGTPDAALREVMAVLGGQAWAALPQDDKEVRLRAVSGIAPLVAPHFQGLLDLKVAHSDVLGLRPPAMLVYGQASFPFEAFVADCFRELRPDLPISVIDDGGHNIHRDRWEIFNALAIPFLER